MLLLVLAFADCLCRLRLRSHMQLGNDELPAGCCAVVYECMKSTVTIASNKLMFCTGRFAPKMCSITIHTNLLAVQPCSHG